LRHQYLDNRKLVRTAPGAHSRAIGRSPNGRFKHHSEWVGGAFASTQPSLGGSGACRRYRQPSLTPPRASPPRQPLPSPLFQRFATCRSTNGRGTEACRYRHGPRTAIHTPYRQAACLRPEMQPGAVAGLRRDYSSPSAHRPSTRRSTPCVCVVTDQSGLTSTSTRTVIIEPQPTRCRDHDARYRLNLSRPN
jgi:hypothetical protein